MVEKFTADLDSTKLSNADYIYLAVLKNYELVLSYITTDLFNISMTKLHFLDCWKVSYATPVFHNVEIISVAKKYMPFTLFSVVNKILKQ